MKVFVCFLALHIIPYFSRSNLVFGDTKENNEDDYLVVLRKDNNSKKTQRISQLKRDMQNMTGLVLGEEFRIGELTLLHVNATEESISELRSRPEVEMIEPNSKASIALEMEEMESEGCELQKVNKQLWGLARIGNKKIPNYDFSDYKYNSTVVGEGVLVYVIDTGIYLSHEDFEGRARWGMTASGIDEEDADLHGHGTHVAGIVGGKTFGIAKKSTLIAVKALDSTGVGYVSWIIEGIQWVVEQHIKNPQHSVINLSLVVKATSDILKVVLIETMSLGIHVTAAAGNTQSNACDLYPAGVPGVITVGASTRSDNIASFSNTGACVDLFAPGEAILSAYITSETASSTTSGTSMAAPFVAGVLACYLSNQTESTSTEEAKQWLLDVASMDTIKVNSGSEVETTNRLLHFECGSAAINTSKILIVTVLFILVRLLANR